ncbi:MAG: S46 family peptidase [Bacteroidales bacterium]|nr:S46 family peptidase [Bacteroidales bacterium]
MRIIAFFLALGLFIFNNTVQADEGMWIPLYLGDLNEAEMQKLGMRITAEDIFSINQPSLKDAVVIFGGGCTAEIVSDEGLILTNHHCGYGRIQAHSSLEHDYLTDGFWAMNRSEELANPGLTVTLLVRMEDVTGRVLEGVDASMSEHVRDMAIRKNIENIEKDAVGDSHYEASVVAFFHGNQYFLFINEVFRDIRLVGAPPSSIGKFGGDTDNWMWPRHTGDFSVFRIYAGPDNKPADYSSENIPYHPKSKMNISLRGVSEGDFTFVFGYPGRTQQYVPSFAVDMQVNTINPARIAIRSEKLDIYEQAMNKDAVIRIQYAAKQAGLANGWKKWIGENRGILRLNEIENKQSEEAGFLRWTHNSPEGEPYQELFREFKSAYEAYKPLANSAIYLNEAGFGPEIIRFAGSFGDLVDISKDPQGGDKWQEEVSRLEKNTTQFFKNFNADVDRKVFASLLSIYHENILPEDQPAVLIDMASMYQMDFQAFADEIFDRTIFSRESAVSDLLESYSPNRSKKIEKDPVYKLARGFRDHYMKHLREEMQYLDNKIDSLQRLYMAGLMKMSQEGRFYPDANSTLRISYGQVKPYYPADATFYDYFTTLEGIMEKEDPDIFDYAVDDELKELYQRKDYGRFADKDGTMHTCFIATCHTTGGNSGSPVLDADGNLIGLNFDRCWEGTMSDIIYDPERCRNIVLDIRYCLFVIDKLAGAGHLLEEMTFIE